MNREAYKKKMYFKRLANWKTELETNQYNMKHLAKRAIKILQKDIEYFWPGLLKQLEKTNGS